MPFLRALPGQSLVLHAVSSRADPTHSCPPFDGEGLSHDLVRVILPDPQLLVHVPKFPHPPHPPSTKTHKMSHMKQQ